MATINHSLLLDGSLRLETAVQLSFAVDPWLPWNLPPTPVSPPPSTAVIELIPSSVRPDEGDGPALLRLGTVAAKVPSSDTIDLHGSDGLSGGRIDLGSLRAELRAEVGITARTIDMPEGSAEEGLERLRTDAVRSVFSMLTLSSAFLLGRLGRTLLHAGAVVAPDGRAWLLVGDTHSGKTTSVLTLIRAGWPFLSDDHVVVCSGEDGGIYAEGWPRTFHVDEGWSAGAVTGRRADVPLDSLESATFQRIAPVAGVLFPEVCPGRRTGSAPVSPATSLQRIVRQSPWLLADRGVAAGLLTLLRRVAVLPAFDLTLGRDSYGDPGRLLSALPDHVRAERPVDA